MTAISKTHIVCYSEGMKLSTKTRMSRFLGRTQDRNVFLRSDFDAFGSPTRVTRAIQELIDEGKIIRIGYGVYARARKSTLTGESVPVDFLEELAADALSQLGVDVRPGKAFRDYSDGVTDQVPMRVSLDVGSSRISRKFRFGEREVALERTRR